ncbi:conserved hypothetical protein [Theileria equi strain WA]|uniref:Uncharacterized protein n=1 Tax=Theileria equi strain WA TaxID=1537102 RepID=L1LDY9_THEEQ|nr:conserved hypothetical protein [Theileria equi strain WA]EKX73566.1 conserved hypothetical protein [Theileria equi strain WA]|eukprot:XP_004833018.1 conserved hypothetical protein [Theileria equi strain WA]
METLLQDKCAVTLLGALNLVLIKVCFERCHSGFASWVSRLILALMYKVSSDGAIVGALSNIGEFISDALGLPIASLMALHRFPFVGDAMIDSLATTHSEELLLWVKAKLIWMLKLLDAPSFLYFEVFALFFIMLVVRTLLLILLVFLLYTQLRRWKSLRKTAPIAIVTLKQITCAMVLNTLIYRNPFSFWLITGSLVMLILEKL